MATETDSKDQYNSSLINLMQNPIALDLDRDVRGKIGPYIKDHLWEHMDENLVKEAIFILDNPILFYEEYTAKAKEDATKAKEAFFEEDTIKIKRALKSLLPTVKKILKIDETHPLKNDIRIIVEPKELDHLIEQDLKLYQERTDTSWRITRLLQKRPADLKKKEKLDFIDMRTDKARESIKQELTVEKVPSTYKTIIANVLTFMILEEEFSKK